MSVLEKTDEELLGEYRLVGDSSLLSHLFLRHVDVGFRTAMRYMRNQTDAEDVLQLAFIQFAKNIDSFRGESSSVKSWLMKIIVNTSLCKLREEKRRSQRQQIVAIEKFNENEKNSESNHMSLEQEELKDKIKNAVETLPEKYRSPIWLVLYEGFSYSEVANVLAVPESTVRTQVARGLKRLKELLEPLASPLSGAMIISLMAASKLEAAPAEVKNKIISSNLHEPLLTKSIHGIRGSRPLQTKVQASIFSSKFIWFAIASLVAGSFYALNSKATQTFDESAVVSNQKLEKKEEDINKTWVFANEADRDIKLLKGSWSWSEKHQGMAPPIDNQIFVALPFSPHEKCIVVEVVLMPLSTRDMPNLNLNFDACWVKERKLLKRESSPYYHYRVKGGATLTIKKYLYQGYVCKVLPGNWIAVNKYPEDLAGSNIVLVLQNYAIQKISCYTINDVPKEIRDVMENFSSGSLWEEVNLE